MITLSGERGLVEVQSWDEVLQLPGFRGDLDPKEHALDSIIGRYMFKDPIRCGLSNCHTPHTKGYIVATKAGLATNIGKDCGKSIFGVDFEAASRKFDRDVREKENRDRLTSFSFSIEEVEGTINSIRKQEKGGDWVYKNLQPLAHANRGVPDEVVRKLREMAKSGNFKLTLEREASEDEIAQEQARTGRAIRRPHIVSETVAEIAGVEALRSQYDIRALLVDDLGANLRRFQECGIDTMTPVQLRDWCKWLDGIERTLELAEAAVRYGRQLLSAGNLKPLESLIQKREDKSAFCKFLRSLAA